MLHNGVQTHVPSCPVNTDKQRYTSDMYKLVHNGVETHHRVLAVNTDRQRYTSDRYELVHNGMETHHCALWYRYQHYKSNRFNQEHDGVETHISPCRVIIDHQYQVGQVWSGAGRCGDFTCWIELFNFFFKIISWKLNELNTRQLKNTLLQQFCEHSTNVRNYLVRVAPLLQLTFWKGKQIEFPVNFVSHNLDNRTEQYTVHQPPHTHSFLKHRKVETLSPACVEENPPYGFLWRVSQWRTLIPSWNIPRAVNTCRAYDVTWMSIGRARTCAGRQRL